MNSSTGTIIRGFFVMSILIIFWYSLGPFIILCQLGKIKNTKGHKYENRNRCRAIC